MLGKIIAALAIALVLAIGYAFHATSLQRGLQRQLAEARAVKPPPVEPTPATAPDIVPVVTDVAPVIESGPDRKILELEERIRAKDDMIASLRQAATNSAPSPESFWRGRQEWLDRLKTEDPKQYEEVMKERDESRRLVREAYARKASHFLEHDASAMAEEERQQYTLMLSLLDDAWKISDQLRAEDLPAEKRRELFGTMHETMEVLSPLLEAERNREFETLALQLGYKEDETAAFVTYVTNIIDATSVRSLIPRNRGGPSGWRNSSTNR